MITIDPILTDMAQQAADFWRTDRDAFEQMAPKWSEELLTMVGTPGCLALVVDLLESRSVCLDETFETYKKMEPLRLAHNAVISLLFRALPPSTGLVPVIQPILTA